MRVSEGGHNIEEEVIRRRYKNGVKNLFGLYLNIIDEAMIYDNSDGEPKLIAEKIAENDLCIYNNRKFTLLTSIL